LGVYLQDTLKASLIPPPCTAFIANKVHLHNGASASMEHLTPDVINLAGFRSYAMIVGILFARDNHRIERLSAVSGLFKVRAC
jgi:hypothetical protein